MSKLILIIEDNKTLAMYEKDILNTAGYDVIVAHDLDTAKTLIQEHKKNIVLSIVDINMPLIEEQALDYLLKHNIPAIAMTGNFHPKLRDKIIDKNIIDYIVLEDDKKLELLQATVNRIMNNENRKVLIVDDSKSSRFALHNLLQSQNFSIFEASDAITALKILQEHNDISIALIDYEMPKMNGAELTRKIRKDFTRAEFSILAISAHADPIITIEFLKAGANDFITKPYVKEEVLARIAVHIDMLNQHKALQSEITIRKSVEKELKLSQKQAHNANLAKSNFLANMSHEVRTPMNAIIGFVDLLYKEERSQTKLEQLHIIKESGDSLMNIINDILDFSKIESGKISIENMLFNTKEPFEFITRLFLEKAKQSDISIQLKIDENVPPKAYGDVTRIKQIYSNLLSNAIKFSSSGSKIEVSITQMIGTQSLLCRVRDYGIGIAEDNQQKIFNMFEQEDNSTTRKFGGSGLGLTISKSLAELMNGKLYVESKLEEGSTFLFEIEVFKDLAQHMNEPLSEEYVDTALSKVPLKAKVLIVEDNKSNQLLMTIILEDLGLDVKTSDDGLEAVAAYQDGGYDLILMDENMPNLNGIEATSQIRKIEKSTKAKAIPIIAITANALKGDREKFLDAGMDDYLSKPIDIIALEKTIRKFLS